MRAMSFSAAATCVSETPLKLALSAVCTCVLRSTIMYSSTPCPDFRLSFADSSSELNASRMFCAFEKTCRSSVAFCTAPEFSGCLSANARASLTSFGTMDWPITFSSCSVDFFTSLILMM